MGCQAVGIRLDTEARAGEAETGEQALEILRRIGGLAVFPDGDIGDV